MAKPVYPRRGTVPKPRKPGGVLPRLKVGDLVKWWYVDPTTGQRTFHWCLVVDPFVHVKPKSGDPLEHKVRIFGGGGLHLVRPTEISFDRPGDDDATPMERRGPGSPQDADYTTAYEKVA